MGAVVTKLEFINKREFGFSLIEILVALFMGLLLILGALNIYLNSLRSDKTNSKIAIMQENVRMVSNVIVSYARRAGYQGCVSSNFETKFVNGSDEQMEYPKDAMVEIEHNGNKGFKFSYATIDVDGKLDPKKVYPYQDCDGNKLGEYSVSFLNDVSNNRILIKTPEFGRYEELVKNVRIVSIRYITFDKKVDGMCDNYMEDGVDGRNGSWGRCYYYNEYASDSSDLIELKIEAFDPQKKVASYSYTLSSLLRNRPSNLLHRGWRELEFQETEKNYNF